MGVELRVLERTQILGGMNTIFGGEPPNNPMRQSITEGGDLVCRISSAIQTRGKVIELA